MKRNLIVILTILACNLVACKPGQKKDGNMEKETKLKKSGTAVRTISIMVVLIIVIIIQQDTTP